MRPANWKEVKNCGLMNSMLFFDGRDFINVGTDYSIDGLWEMHDDEDDDAIVALIVLKLPKTFEEFRERYTHINWSVVRDDIDNNVGLHTFAARLRDMRFAKGQKAACLFAHMLEDAQSAGVQYFESDSKHIDVRSIKVGDMKRIFDPSYKSKA